MVDTIRIVYKGQNEPFYYIRLGALLEYIQDHIMYIIQIDESTTSPLLKFDTEVETNLMYIENMQISVDPNICLVNRTLTDLSGNSYNFTNYDGQQADPFESSLFQGYNCYGNIMNIYVHMKWVLLELDRLKDSNSGKVVLIDFLNSILSSINSALGGINSLEATIEEITNTIIIRDKNPLPNIDLVTSTLNKFYTDKKINKQIPNEFTLFDLYGYSTDQPKVYDSLGHASFIKDFNFTTEITPQLSTMLTVGATANSTVVGENSTAFSRFNAGLKDRFKIRIVDPAPPDQNVENFINSLLPASVSSNQPLPQPTTNSDLDDEQNVLIGKYAGTYASYIAYVRKLAMPNPEYNSGEADTYKSAVSNFVTYLQQIRQIAIKKVNSKAVPDFLPGTGFIPFNMSVTMNGLSGMKIYNKFNIDTDFLPANYPDNAEFLIKGITHKIENNRWDTTLESIVIIKGSYDKKKSPSPSPNTTDNVTDGAPSNDNDTENYYRSLLNKLGAPLTQGNIIFLKAWRQAEGGKAKWNAFNTTLNKPGATNYNNIGVKNYTSLEQGVQATFDTLSIKKYYAGIVNTLRNGIKDQQEALNTAIQLQKRNQSLWIWTKGPNSKASDDTGYVANILRYNVRNIPIYK